VLPKDDLDAFDPEDVLRNLHGFQRDAAEYAFHRLYVAPDSTRRFLVADEVGLGKTLIARGVLSKALAHLRGTVERIDIIYICSNLRIAKQNVNRLNPLPNLEFTDAERITLLPLNAEPMRSTGINFVAFTPGTSLDLKGSLGVVRERALLYALLADHWTLTGVAALNVLQGNVQDAEKFRACARDLQRNANISKPLLNRFHALLDGKPEVRVEFEALCGLMGRQRPSVPDDIRTRRNSLVGTLRRLLAEACIEDLQPDLVILDEFQRFKELLNPNSDQGELASQLFDWSTDHEAARVLLLSATPYKAYTLRHEIAEEDHYKDFLSTVKFLDPGDGEALLLNELLARYRQQLLTLNSSDGQELVAIKNTIEQHLRRVISRTERINGNTSASSNMLRVPHAQTMNVTAADLSAYAAIRGLADALEVDDTLEYWKSAAYPLNFMEGYQLRAVLADRIVDGEKKEELLAAMYAAQPACLPFDAIANYQQLPIPNARLRDLMQTLERERAFELLWLAPSFPYYPPAGPFASEKNTLTKRLIFSAWHLVPRSIAALLSYEAERRAISVDEEHPVNTPEARKARRGLLRLSLTDGRPGGMSALTMMYPCKTLASLCDPLDFFRARRMQQDLSDIVQWAEARVRAALLPEIQVAAPGEPADEQWYWAAPILLDSTAGAVLASPWESSPISDESQSDSEGAEDSAEGGGDAGWNQHVQLARDVAGGMYRPAGKAPADLVHRLALIGLAGPATTALRAFQRLYPMADSKSETIGRAAAERIGWGFRALFNRSESTAIVRRGRREEPYWKLALEYCHDGCLSAVLDEYLHVLRDARGLTTASAERAIPAIAEAAVSALQVRTASLTLDRFGIDVSAGEITHGKHSMRSLFAMRFGTDATENEKQVRRDTVVGEAFNSPFWPFVLATTSVGQEGLDFHWYCHAVVHWNLPSNPVDLEQREGRVHRFKGHAVRKNVAQACGAIALESFEPDVWREMFRRAADRSALDRGLVPYWVFPQVDGAWIERHIPVYPLSRDAARFVALQRSLAAYRIVFGQPRQDELLAYLLSTVDDAKIRKFASELRIDLSPPKFNAQSSTEHV
jgi:hypothetical protein